LNTQTNHTREHSLGNRQEHAACGIGFIASREGLYCHSHLQQGLQGLVRVEHRGALDLDGKTGDGAGIMTDIPFELLGYEHGSIALATLFLQVESEEQRKALKIFEETFQFFGMKILAYRDVPTAPEVLGERARASMPKILHAIIERPKHCSTDMSFDRLLHQAHRHTLSRLKGHNQALYFPSLSANTVVYKAMVRSDLLEQFYLDLQNPMFKTRFVVFHRRFSTNTVSSWDKAQPFRLIGHNGEFNTIQGNRSWSYSREKSLGLRSNELLTHTGISDSGSLNEMVEALLFRSSIPRVQDVLAILMPPAQSDNDFYRFWSRAMEPWDGPACILFSNGETVGARLDRNGFRPCRWSLTKEHLFLCSEAGVFEVDESLILEKGTLQAGSGVSVELRTGKMITKDPGKALENEDAHFDARLFPLPEGPRPEHAKVLHKLPLFGYTDEDLHKVLIPMAQEGKEPIGSMGDTSRPAVFSELPRSLFDYFYQCFAQVTNPPLDYIREKIVTDLRTFLGPCPNIFAPNELIPPKPGYALSSPLLDLEQIEVLWEWQRRSEKSAGEQQVQHFDMKFNRAHGVVGMRSVLKSIAEGAVKAASQGIPILLLSDRHATAEEPPIPSLLVLRTVTNALNEAGMRLDTSIVVESAEIRSPHEFATLIGFGATAVCPNLALEFVRFSAHRKLEKIPIEEREHLLLQAFEKGLLKIMAKMGISVVRSYQSAKLFLAMGLGPKIVKTFFPGINSPIGGVELEDLCEQIITRVQSLPPLQEYKPDKTYIYREHNKGLVGEKHSMTNTLSKMLHTIVRDERSVDELREDYKEYLSLADGSLPMHIRDLFSFSSDNPALPLDDVLPGRDITRRFGSGAMSFGAISAESQRDLILAMHELGGRSNSGEGGENPYYYTEGITCNVKQIASGRFGVTAEYLVTSEEIQIKIAQGAKPGEGGQLLASKVSEEIAKARHAKPGIALISPPPLHDIYSIEDLKELICELKQLNHTARVSVKLVSGPGIGTIAVGVAKAGADIIHVAGGDGGTGAASLMSMRHAGLPWELGLMEVHRVLVDNDLREKVTLRVDGGLHRGKDIILAAIMGAQEYDFGKLLLIAEGCVMARICEKNTCPTGIATHDPKFKAKYKGQSEHIVKLLQLLAEDVRHHLATLGFSSLDDLLGRTDLLHINEQQRPLIEQRHLDLSFFLQKAYPTEGKDVFHPHHIGRLNQKLLDDTKPALQGERHVSKQYAIKSTDRAVLATLSGVMAKQVKQHRTQATQNAFGVETPTCTPIQLEFKGSAGQGFGVFLVDGLEVQLYGEANDSVCKSMSGGKMVIQPPPEAAYARDTNTIIGNGALYGATGGKLFVHGLAGARFAVRNSGATAVVEGTGYHACEYMTDGYIVILGDCSPNLGAGMTGGTVFVYKPKPSHHHTGYITPQALTQEDEHTVRGLLLEYLEETGSHKAKRLLEHWDTEHQHLIKFVPIES